MCSHCVLFLLRPCENGEQVGESWGPLAGLGRTQPSVYLLLVTEHAAEGGVVRLATFYYALQYSMLYVSIKLYKLNIRILRNVFKLSAFCEKL